MQTSVSTSTFNPLTEADCCQAPTKALRLSLAGAMQECSRMCDYSLQSVLSRSAKVGDRLTTRDFAEAASPY